VSSMSGKAEIFAGNQRILCLTGISSSSSLIRIGQARMVRFNRLVLLVLDHGFRSWTVKGILFSFCAQSVAKHHLEQA